ncbi:hypothetical protein ACFFRR_003945 [Megaselia abdita]
MFASKVLLPVAAVLCFIASSEAIKCYKCSSYSDLNCAREELLKGNSNMANMVDCDLDRRPSYAQPGQMVSKCAYMTIKDSAGVVVKRDCHWENDMQRPDMCFAGSNVEIGECKVCKGDYCNSGTKMALGITSLAALILAMKVFC